MQTVTEVKSLTVKPQLVTVAQDRTGKKPYWCGVRPGHLPNGEVMPYPPFQNENFGGADFPLFRQVPEPTEENEPGYGQVWRLGSRFRGKVNWLTEAEKNEVLSHIAVTVYRITKRTAEPLLKTDPVKVFYTATRFSAGDPKMGTDSAWDVPAARFCFMVPAESLPPGHDSMTADWPQSAEASMSAEPPPAPPVAPDADAKPEAKKKDTKAA